MRRVIYYDDLLNDEFSTAKIKTKRIDGNYVYIRNGIFFRMMRFLLYRPIAAPLARVYLFFKFRHKIVNRELLQTEKDGCFLYGNHTQTIADAVLPGVLGGKKNAYVIVHPNNVSMPVLGRVTPLLGAIPLPDDKAAAENFIRTVRKRIRENEVVAIYPEKHIWPYYTKIRPFGESSFRYPVKYDKPAYCFTNAYLARGRRKNKARLVTYIDGPFYADKTLAAAQARKKLRDEVYAQMRIRAENSDIQMIRYEKRRTE